MCILHKNPFLSSLLITKVDFRKKKQQLTVFFKLKKSKYKGVLIGEMKSKIGALFHDFFYFVY